MYTRPKQRSSWPIACVQLCTLAHVANAVRVSKKRGSIFQQRIGLTNSTAHKRVNIFKTSRKVLSHQASIVNRSLAIPIGSDDAAEEAQKLLLVDSGKMCPMHGEDMIGCALGCTCWSRRTQRCYPKMILFSPPGQTSNSLPRPGPKEVDVGVCQASLGFLVLMSFLGFGICFSSLLGLQFLIWMRYSSQDQPKVPARVSFHDRSRVRQTIPPDEPEIQQKPQETGSSVNSDRPAGSWIRGRVTRSFNKQERPQRADGPVAFDPTPPSSFFNAAPSVEFDSTPPGMPFVDASSDEADA